jgi:hypothetical protein
LFFSLNELHVLSRKLRQGVTDAREVLNKVAVEVSKPEEAAYALRGLQRFLIPNGLDLLRIHRDSLADLNNKA